MLFSSFKNGTSEKGHILGHFSFFGGKKVKKLDSSKDMYIIVLTPIRYRCVL
jgi:hypothetical protein